MIAHRRDGLMPPHLDTPRGRAQQAGTQSNSAAAGSGMGLPAARHLAGDAPGKRHTFRPALVRSPSQLSTKAAVQAVRHVSR